MNTSSLHFLGWNNFFQQQYLQNVSSAQYSLGRVIAENKTNYIVLNNDGDFLAEVAGRLLFEADNDASLLPKVGDWVYLTVFDEGRAIIHAVLERKTVLSRTSAGRSMNEQIIATNLDRVFIVQGLDNNFNLRRMERFLTMTDGTGIEPIVVLNKADVCEGVSERLEQVQKEIPTVRVLALSAYSNEGVSALAELIENGMTVAFVGSSGVGKSTLINSLLGKDCQSTSHISQNNSKGRHTTTRRELIVLESGGIVIDTPGMRELQLAYNEEGDFENAFADIHEAAQNCRFRSCTHTQETGCAVWSEIDAGRISEQHFRSYQKLSREQAYLAAKSSKEAERSRKEQMKRIQKEANTRIRARR